MNIGSFPDISRVFSNQLHVSPILRLRDARALQAIVIFGPQVGGMLECESIQPYKSW